MAKVRTLLTDTIETWRTNTNQISENIGDLANLTTDEDSDVVGALNSLDSNVGTRGDLTTTNKTSIVEAINEVDSDIGVISSLNTTAKQNIVSSINEIDYRVDSLDALLDQAVLRSSDVDFNSINVVDSSRFDDNLSVAGNTAVNTFNAKTATVSGNTSLNNLSISGSVTSNLNVQDSSRINDNLSVAGSLLVGGVSNLQDVNTQNLFAADSSRFATNLSIGGNAHIGGDLSVKGTVNFVNSNTVDIGDNIILLNGDVTGSPTENAGLEVERGTSTNAKFLWNEAGNYWSATNSDGSVGVHRVVTTGDPGLVSNGMLANSTITFGNSTATSARALGQSVTIRGTLDQTVVGYSGGTFTVGLADSLTIPGDFNAGGDVNVTGVLNVGGDFVTGGDFVVQGTQKIQTNFLELLDSNTSNGVPSSFGRVSGLKINRGTATNVYFAYDDSIDTFVWYDSGAVGFAKNTFLTNNNLNVTAPIQYSETLQGVTLSARLATTTLTGVASFSSNDFDVTGGVVTVKSGGITNTQLANSSVTVNSKSVSLGNSVALVTDDIAEDASPTNLWFTDARAKGAVSATNSGTGYGALSYSSSTGTFTFTKVTSANIRANISVSDTGGYGSLSYDSGTGVITYTGPSDADIRGRFSGDSGITYNSTTGVISINTTGVDSATYGSGTAIPVITVNSRGQITKATTTSVAGVSGVSYDTSTGLLTVSTAAGTSFSDSITLAPFSTSDLAEGTNEYFTQARARGSVGVTASTGLSYESSTGAFSGVNASTSTKGVASFSSTSFSTEAGAVSIKEGGVSNAMLAGSIANSKLTNSSITINGSAISLGGSVTVGTSNVASINDLTDGFTSSTSIAIGTHSVDAGNVNTTTLGIGAGNALTTGDDMTLIGYQAGDRITTGIKNTLIGSKIGNIGGTSSNNTAVGHGALSVYSGTERDVRHSYNTAIGHRAGGNIGENINSCDDNVFIGNDAGLNMGSGGPSNTYGNVDYNVIIGGLAHSSAYWGDNNIVIGYNASGSSLTVSNEITLGNASISRFRVADGNILNVTGAQNAANGVVVKNGSNRIVSDLEVPTFIYHEGDTDTLIHFETDKITLEAGGVEMIEMVEGATDYIDFVDRVRVTAAGDLECEGDIIAFTSTTVSDINQKDNIEVIPDALNKVQQLNGVSFNWKETQESSAGVIAQDVEKVLPEIVKVKTVRDSEPFKTVNYDGLVGLLIEAVKELSSEVEELKKKLDNSCCG